MAPIDSSLSPSKEVHNHGMALEPTNTRIQCCHCGKVVSGFNRLQYHLAGIRGNVTECLDVPDDVKAFFRGALLAVRRSHLMNEVSDLSLAEPSSKKRCSSKGKAHAVNLDQVAEPPNGHTQAQKPRLLSEFLSSSNDSLASLRTSSGEVEMNPMSIMEKRSIGRFFFANAIDFSAIKSPSFQSMMGINLSNREAIRSIPSMVELKGWILESELSDIESYVKNIQRSWPRTGCSVLLDGWTDQLGRSLINVIVDCPEGPIYLRSADVSSATKGADALRQLLETILEEVGIQNVIQIVIHTSSDELEAVCRQLVEKYRSLFWAVSATHCISLILDKIASTNPIKTTLESAKIITKFIYGRPEVLKLLQKCLNGHDLVKTSKIKSAASFLTLENFMIEQSNIESMFASSEWRGFHWASTVEGKIVANLVSELSFWSGVEHAVRAAIPLVKAMSLINGDGEPHMGFIYETMDQIKETISDEFNGKKSQYSQYWTIIDEVWNRILYSPLHSAGYFLNPRLHYTEDFYSDSEVAGGLLVTFVRLGGDQHAQDIITEQLDLYRNCGGNFKFGTENSEKDRLSPAEWWSHFGNHCPELQRLAIRILSQTCNGAESFGLRRDLAEKLLNTGGSVTEERLQRHLTYLNYNLKLKDFKTGTKFNICADEIDPTDDWVVDEYYSVEARNSGSMPSAQVDDHVAGASGSSSTTPGNSGFPSFPQWMLV